MILHLQVVELISLSRPFYHEIGIHKELQVLVEHKERELKKAMIKMKMTVGRSRLDVAESAEILIK